MMKVELVFGPRQVLVHLNALTHNPKHRAYPRGKHDSDIVSMYRGDLRAEIPEEYRDRLEPVIQRWVDNLKELHTYQYVCPGLPSLGGPIVPYGYLKSEKTV